jgi:hypothetical protein
MPIRCGHLKWKYFHYQGLFCSAVFAAQMATLRHRAWTSPRDGRWMTLQAALGKQRDGIKPVCAEPALPPATAATRRSAIPSPSSTQANLLPTDIPLARALELRREGLS